MKTEFKLLDAVCGWCSDATECVVVKLDNGLEMDLCWKCVKNKARAEAKHGQSIKEEVASSQSPSWARATGMATEGRSGERSCEA